MKNNEKFKMRKIKKDLLEKFAFKKIRSQKKIFDIWIERTLKFKSDTHFKFYKYFNNRNNDKFFLLKDIEGIYDFLSLFKEFWDEYEEAVNFRDLLINLNDCIKYQNMIKHEKYIKNKLASFLMRTFNNNKDLIILTLKIHPDFISHFYYPFVFYYDLDNIINQNSFHKEFKKNFKEVLEF